MVIGSMYCEHRVFFIVAIASHGCIDDSLKNRIELYSTRVKHIDYWSPSSFHNGPPTIKIVKHIDSLINYLYDPPTKFT